MNILALLHFTAFLLYVWLIIVVISRAPRSRLNQAFALFTAFWAVAAFGTAFMTAAPDKSGAIFWCNLSAAGYCGAYSFLLWFFLIYAEKERILSSRWFFPVIFSIPLILYYNVWKGNLVADAVPTMFHSWGYVWSKSIWPDIFYIYNSGFTAAGLWMVFRSGQKAEDPHKRKQAGIIVVSGIISAILGVTSDMILPGLRIPFPPVSNITTLIWAGSIAYAITKYGLMALTPATAGEDIFSTMADSLILVDPEGNIIRANAATGDLLGYTDEEIIGKPAGMIFAEEEEKEELPFIGAKLKKLVKDGFVRDSDMAYRAKSGEIIPVDFSGSVMRDEDGNLSGIVGIARDMREIKRLIKKEKEIASVEKARVAELDTAVVLEFRV